MARNPHARYSARYLRPSSRSWLGLVLAIAGAALLFIGWYRVSGETLVAAQIPYLASASIPGAALVVAGAVLIGSELVRRADEQGDHRVDTLYALLTEEIPSETGAGRDPAAEVGEPVVALPDGTYYHRPRCLLVEGKPDVRPVPAEEVRRSGLRPCQVCSPDPVE